MRPAARQGKLGRAAPWSAALTARMCHSNVSHMKTTSIRELKHDTTTVLAWVAEGESVEVRRRGVPVAVLTPRKRGARIARPDFAARLRAIYGDTVLPTTATDVVAEARGDS